MTKEIQLLPFTPRLRSEVAALGGWLEGLTPIAGDGSDRLFFRMPGEKRSLVLLSQPQPPGSPVTENDSYFYIGRHLRQQGLPLPEIYAYCREEGWFLLEDLGDLSLDEEITLRPAPAAILDWCRQAMELLVRLQIQGREGFSSSWCYDTPVYDAGLVKERECHYFVRAFLQGFAGLEISPEGLEEEFDRLIAGALQPGNLYLLYRDFQPRNLMIREGCLWLVDFQGSRLGPLQYDLAAFLTDNQGLPAELQEILLGDYLKILQTFIEVDVAAWLEQYHYLALCRNLQILGAYGFLSQVKGKSQFLQYIPPALQALRRRLGEGKGEDFPRLRRVAEEAGAKLAL